MFIFVGDAMKAVNSERTETLLGQSLGTVLAVVLSFLPLVLLAWMFEGGERGMFFGTFTAVLSGGIFREEWHPIHAGFVLDQPTIGKWYFWFSVFTAVWLPYMAAVKYFFIRRSTPRRMIFAAGITFLCLFLACLLTIPFWWLIQYIQAMGWTPKRAFGLFYAAGAYGILFIFWYRTVIAKRRIGPAE